LDTGNYFMKNLTSEDIMNAAAAILLACACLMVIKTTWLFMFASRVELMEMAK